MDSTPPTNMDAAPVTPPASTGLPVTSAPDPVGAAAIKAVASTLGEGPGVYRMLDADGQVLYVGKARNLRRRVDSYTRPHLEARIARMVEKTASMEVVATRTENEALLLEQSLVRSLRPTTNIRLREGRGFPGLLLTTSQPFPRVARHRGRPAHGDRLFGPFADGRSVDRAVRDVERLFRLRSCDDATYAGRTRPCLNHQIGRCSAPCVGKVNAQAYQAQVQQAIAFLEGRKTEARQMLEARMLEAATQERYEEAAALRDRIHAIAQMGEAQGVAGIPGESLDAVAIALEGPRAIVVALFARRGALQGHREIAVDTAGCTDPGAILDSVLPEIYAHMDPPERILLSHPLPQDGWAEGALAHKADRAIHIGHGANGARKRLLDTALHAASEGLARKAREQASWKADFARLGHTLGLAQPPKRVEIFDNSHLSGTDALGVAVVATDEGFLPSHYRTYRFPPESGVAGNDVGMMEAMMARRFKRLAEGAPRPDLLLIDGGPTQLAAVSRALDALGVGDIPRVGVAKGEFRDHGLETLHFVDGRTMALPHKDPTLYCIQRLRDEAHRFAIGTQRKARTKRITEGPLDGIEGLGPARKRALIARFGSQKAASTASVEELTAVAGIGPDLARRIRDAQA